MTMHNLVVKHKPRETEMDTPWGAQLKGLEHTINKHEGEALEARWKSGRLLLTKREGKQLPKGMRDLLVAQLGISKGELAARMKFAEKFATDREVSDAVRHFKTWRAMVHEALVDRPKDKPAKKHAGVRPTLKRALTLLVSIDVPHLSRTDCDLLDLLEREIKRIHEEIDRRQIRSA